MEKECRREQQKVKEEKRVPLEKTAEERKKEVLHSLQRLELLEKKKQNHDKMDKMNRMRMGMQQKTKYWFALFCLFRLFRLGHETRSSKNKTVGVQQKKTKHLEQGGKWMA